MEVSKYSLLGTTPVRSMSISSLGYIFVRLWSYSRLYYLPLLFKKFNENDILKRRVQIPQQILTSLLGLQLPILETVSFIKDPLPHLLDFTSHNGTADHLIKAVQEVGKRAKLIVTLIVTLICYPHLLPSLFYTGTNQ